MNKVKYEDDLREVTATLKEKIERLKVESKRLRIEQSKKDLQLSKIINQADEDKLVEDAKHEIAMYK